MTSDCAASLPEVGHGVGRDSWALSMLHRHPWQKALLDSGRLRADCLGPAALDLLSDHETERERNVSFARTLYGSRQYGSVLRLLDNIQPSAPLRVLVLRIQRPCDVPVLPAKAGRRLHIDADWRRLPDAITEAEAAYARIPLSALDSDKMREILAKFTRAE